MSTGLLYGSDDFVAKWLFDSMGYPHYKYDRALGIIDGSSGNLVGAVLFQHWNGMNVEVSYYGKNTMTLGTVRSIARFVLTEFDPARLSATTSKRNRSLMRSLQKIGFRIEGTSRCFYGKKDINRNVGVRFVAFREAIEAMAKINQEAA
jgi:RimJ/RimL family protein N-acetyltransferase